MLENGNVDNGSGLPEEFASLLNESQGDASGDNNLQVPEKIGELPLEQFNKILGEASGGAINDYNAFQKVVSLQEKYSSLENENKSLHERMKVFEGGPKFENELVDKLNSMYKSGATDEQIYRFLEMQKIDIDAMSDMDVVTRMYKEEYPEFTPEEIQELIKDEFGDLEEVRGKAKLRKAAADGRSKLAEMKVNVSEPESVRKQKAAQSELESKFKNWNVVTNSLYGKKEKHEVNLTVGDQKVNIPISIPEDVRGKLSVEIAKYAVQNNIPPTKEGMAHLQEYAERSMMFLYGKQILETLFRDTKAQTTQELLQKFHNSSPTNRGTGGNGNPNPTVITKEKTGLEKLKEQRNKELGLG